MLTKLNSKPNPLTFSFMETILLRKDVHPYTNEALDLQTFQFHYIISFDLNYLCESYYLTTTELEGTLL